MDIAEGINLPDNYILIKKNVKHARLRVNVDLFVRVIIPLNFTHEDVNALIRKKQGWINKHLKFFKEKTKINLQRNELLLFGNRYSYFYDSTCGHKVFIDYEYKTIRAKKIYWIGLFRKNIIRT